ncbi:MAG TPA: phosphoenolpyruvate--protein phosphotransferase [Lachnospiraceae bacterium]|nr:phosphoenolpyruvate--protein phosphotransferase [Lachnospiraceae bacterium]HIS62296.1 phosphoenolpyruvate--protein phosphotransferase [Candidatus Scybalomonas excrementigallinarum]
MYKGIGASAGIGIGNIVIIKEQSLEYTARTITDVEAEIARINGAIDTFSAKTQAMAEDIKQRLGEKEAEILEGQLLMVMDPSLTSEMENLIKAGQCAESALETVCDMFIQVFSMAEDELTRQRATDIHDIKTRVLKILLGIEEVDISAVPAGTVLVARDLTPSMTAGINKDNVVGILTEVGGKTSHSAILARALEIPAVLSIEGIVSKVENGQMVILDGSTGDVFLNPSEEEVATYSAKRDAYLEEKKALGKFIGQATMTADGKKVELVANIGTPEEATKVVECDGEGVGLFRTEFLFMDRTSIPTEEEQFEAYKKAAIILRGKPVIIRTLDVGGDKEIPYLGLEKEENPFLGYRAVRFCLDREEIYRPQLRALLRASAFGEIRIMVPLVTCVDELTSVKALVKEIMAELDKEGIAYNKEIQIGVMIETPAASLIADLLAKEASFFSIGTNDLTQYTMAVDRGNAKVAYLYSAYNPAVLRSIKRVIECGKAEGIMVGMCGEAASDPMLIPLLISFGLDEFSVSATSVLATRKTISQYTKEEADKIAEGAMKLTTEKEVAEYLKANIK